MISIKTRIMFQWGRGTELDSLENRVVDRLWKNQLDFCIVSLQFAVELAVPVYIVQGSLPDFHLCLQ